MLSRHRRGTLLQFLRVRYGKLVDPQKTGWRSSSRWRSHLLRLGWSTTINWSVVGAGTSAARLLPLLCVILAVPATMIVQGAEAKEPESLGVLTKEMGLSDPVNAIAISPDSRTLAIGSGRRRGFIADVVPRSKESLQEVYQTGLAIDLWNLKKAKLRGRLRGHCNAIEDVTFSSDGTLLASASMDKTVRIWDIPNQKQLKVLRGEPNTAGTCVEFSPDNELIAAGFWGGNQEDSFRGAILWDRQSYNRVLTLRAHLEVLGVRSLDFAPDSSVLATCGMTKFLKIWNPRSGKNHGCLKLGENTSKSSYFVTRDVAFAADGFLIAAGGDRKFGARREAIVRVWNTKVYSLAGTYKPKDARSTTCIAFSPGGKMLIAGNMDGTILFLKPPDLKLALTISHGEPVRDVAVSADGGLLLSAGPESVKLWSLDELACSGLGE